MRHAPTIVLCLLGLSCKGPLAGLVSLSGVPAPIVATESGASATQAPRAPSTAGAVLHSSTEPPVRTAAAAGGAKPKERYYEPDSSVIDKFLRPQTEGPFYDVMLLSEKHADLDTIGPSVSHIAMIHHLMSTCLSFNEEMGGRLANPDQFFVMSLVWCTSEPVDPAKAKQEIAQSTASPELQEYFNRMVDEVMRRRKTSKEIEGVYSGPHKERSVIRKN